MPLKFTRITPSLPVNSVPASIEWYTTKLGFRLAGRDRDDHTWLQLIGEEDSYGRYDAPVNVYLRRRGFPDVEDDKGPGKIYIRCDGEEDDLKALFEKLVQDEVSVTAGISVKPWGVRDFTVEDLDGNMINFSQQVAGWTPTEQTSENLPLGYSLRYQSRMKSVS